MSTDWIQALKETILGSRWYCLSVSVVLLGVLSPGRRRTKEAGTTVVKAYTAKACSCILSSTFFVDCEEIKVYIRLEYMEMSYL